MLPSDPQGKAKTPVVAIRNVNQSTLMVMTESGSHNFPRCPACRRSMTIVRETVRKIDGRTSVFECPDCQFISIEGAKLKAPSDGLDRLLFD